MVAALGTWAVATDAGAQPGQRYVVAARPIGPGQRITAGDLTSLTADLPSALRSQAFSDPDEVIDTVALGPLAPGDLLQAGSLAGASGTPDEREVSIAVEKDWAVAGRLRPGDHIDVFVTEDGAEGPTSRRVLADAAIRRLDSSEGDGLGESRSQVLTVSVTDDDDITSLVTAARAGDLTVLRVTGTAPDTSPDQAPSEAADSGADATSTSPSKPTRPKEDSGG